MKRKQNKISIMTWKKNLLTPKASILKAIQVIDAAAYKIIFVVDARGKLLGTVTDGDVRRGILRGVSVGQSIQNVMNKKPNVGFQNEKLPKIVLKMKEKKIKQIPILNNQGQIIDVKNLDEWALRTYEKNWVILMVGGLGKRLRPLTDHLPKPLLKVGEKPILETIIENFMEYGFKKFFLSVHYKEHMLKKYFKDGSKWGIEIKYLTETDPLGTAGALSLLPCRPKQPIVVMNGDLLTKVNFENLMEFHDEHKAQVTMCVRDYEFQVPFGVVNLRNETVDSIKEKPLHHFFVNAGIYVLQPEVLNLIPHKKAIDMPAVLNKLKKNGNSIAAYPIREYWIDIGHRDNLDRAHQEYSLIFG